MRRGLLLAGGNGTRLFPVTEAISKQLLPVHDKPMIYYPLSVLMLAGIRDILVITRPQDAVLFQRCLGDGSRWGLSIRYAEQAEPRGLPDAFIVGREFIGSAPCALALGDNILYGSGLRRLLDVPMESATGATVFAYSVRDPERYGVVTLDARGRPTSIEEKPSSPRSNLAITGFYFFDAQVADLAADLAPSSRGELEITDILRQYWRRGVLDVVPFGRGYAWFDTGTHDSLMQASQFIQAIEDRQGLKVACLEEIAYLMGFIDAAQVERRAAELQNSSYGAYLRTLIAEGIGGPT